MLQTTVNAMKEMLKADPSVSVPERQIIVAALRGKPTVANQPPAVEDRLLSVRETARLLNVSTRQVHRLAQFGTLRKVKVSPRKTGFSNRELVGLVNAGGAVE